MGIGEYEQEIRRRILNKSLPFQETALIFTFGSRFMSAMGWSSVQSYGRVLNFDYAYDSGVVDVQRSAARRPMSTMRAGRPGSCPIPLFRIGTHSAV